MIIDALHRELIRVQCICLIMALLVFSIGHWGHLHFAGDTLIPLLLLLCIAFCRLILLVRAIRAGSLDDTGRNGVQRTIEYQRNPFLFCCVSALYLLIWFGAILLLALFLHDAAVDPASNTPPLTSLAFTIC